MVALLEGVLEHARHKTHSQREEWPRLYSQAAAVLQVLN